MKVLALDGALGPFSCCALDGSTATAAATGGADGLEAGLALVAATLRRGGLTLDALDRIAVGTGPGLFTGLRIAVSYAKGLALARRLPLVGISSYDALEPPNLEAPVLTIVQGREGVICARLRSGDRMHVRCGRTDDVVDAFSADLHGVTLVGATKDVLSALGERGLTVRTVPNRTAIPAQAVAELALQREPAPNPHALRPDYGELPAAKVPKLS